MQQYQPRKTFGAVTIPQEILDALNVTEQAKQDLTTAQGALNDAQQAAATAQQTFTTAQQASETAVQRLHEVIDRNYPVPAH